MNTEKPTLKFQIDVIDFRDDEEILNTIKNLLKLSKDKEFIDNVLWKDGVKVKISPNISFVISYCNNFY